MFGTSHDLRHAKVFIALFVLDGCPACEEFKPRFVQAIEAFLRRNPGVPVAIYDAASPDPALQALMTRYGIEATPTLLILPRGRGHIAVPGSLDGPSLNHYLSLAEAVHRSP